MTRSENIPLNLIWIIPAQGYASSLLPLLCHYLLTPNPVLLIRSSYSVADTSEQHRRRQVQSSHTPLILSSFHQPFPFFCWPILLCSNYPVFFFRSWGSCLLQAPILPTIQLFVPKCKFVLPLNWVAQSLSPATFRHPALNSPVDSLQRALPITCHLSSLLPCFQLRTEFNQKFTRQTLRSKRRYAQPK
jgi:hypothetical protein